MFFLIKEYIKFLSISTNQHGVHSPFIFQFVTKCLYVKPSFEDLILYKKYRSRVLKSCEVIEVEDSVSGLRFFKSHKRKVSEIIKVAGVKKSYGLLLMRMMSYFEVKKCLEIGTSLGLVSFCLKAKQPEMQLTTLEGCKNTLAVAKDQFDYFGLKNINTVLGEFNQTLPGLVKNDTFDVVYFDGNHTKKATLNYFEQCLKSKHNDSVFIFDDIHWSTETLEAWELIKNHAEVTVTVDIFQWGIVFFRREQRKEHFIIRS